MNERDPNLIIDAGLIKALRPPAPRDAWSLGTADGSTAAGITPVIIDGDTAASNCVGALAEEGDRVLLCLLGRARVLVANLTTPAGGPMTAAEILAALLTVDGSGSGLDADLLDGNSSAAFLLASAYTAADVLTKVKTVDGTGTGLDADLLDGSHAAAFAAAAAGVTNGDAHNHLGGDGGAIARSSLTEDFSHVYANRGTAQAISDGTAVVYDTEVTDTKAEYNPATGLFTAAVAGWYQVNAALAATGATWATAVYWLIQISFGASGASVAYGQRWTSIGTGTSASVYASSTISRVVYLAAGETIQIKVRQSRGSAINCHNDASSNWLTIDRIA